MGTDYTVSHAAALASCLPSEGAVARAEGDGWSEAERILAVCERHLHLIWWQRTRDGERNRNQPDLIKTPAERARAVEDSARYTRSYMDDVADALGIPEDRR